MSSEQGFISKFFALSGLIVVGISNYFLGQVTYLLFTLSAGLGGLGELFASGIFLAWGGVIYCLGNLLLLFGQIWKQNKYFGSISIIQQIISMGPGTAVLYISLQYPKGLEIDLIIFLIILFILPVSFLILSIPSVTNDE